MKSSGHSPDLRLDVGEGMAQYLTSSRNRATHVVQINQTYLELAVVSVAEVACIDRAK
jgi:hypothetical protein